MCNGINFRSSPFPSISLIQNSIYYVNINNLFLISLILVNLLQQKYNCKLETILDN